MLDQSQIQVLILIGLAAIFAGSIAYFFMFRKIETESRTSRRMEKLGDPQKKASGGRQRNAAASRLADASKRRKSVENSLSDMEDKQKQKAARSTRPSLKAMLRQSGLPMSVSNFYAISAGLAVALFIVCLISGQELWICGLAGLAGGFGLPRLFVIRARKKRFKAFSKEFPNAVDVLVRGVKSGLPINDCFKIIAQESAEPVAGEFKKIIEAQQVGLTLTQAVQRFYESVPLSETNFFVIVLTIQSQAGGNLSEALGNLSNVLRDRTKMQAKIKAMSAEAIASGGIIGCLPVAVTTLLAIVSPDYISVLFTHETGNFALLIIGFWMSCGIFVMRQMINFDF